MRPMRCRSKGCERCPPTREPPDTSNPCSATAGMPPRQLQLAALEIRSGCWEVEGVEPQTASIVGGASSACITRMGLFGAPEHPSGKLLWITYYRCGRRAIQRRPARGDPRVVAARPGDGRPEPAPARAPR